MNKYCQYGCGFSNPNEFLNFDASPTLKMQKIPLIGQLLKGFMSTKFPLNIKVGDIVKGLPVPNNSMKGVYCSHVLEHLALEDLRIALKNSYDILEKDGVFRCVLPDLQWCCDEYLKQKNLGNIDAAFVFMDEYTMLGKHHRPKGIMNRIKALYGNSAHLWMWDYESLKLELEKVGFKKIRRAQFNDSIDSHFKFVEEEGRFHNCLAIECQK